MSEPNEDQIIRDAEEAAAEAEAATPPPPPPVNPEASAQATAAAIRSESAKVRQLEQEVGGLRSALVEVTTICSGIFRAQGHGKVAAALDGIAGELGS